MKKREEGSATNLIGVESEVHVFFQNEVDEDLRTKAACILLGALGELYGGNRAPGRKTCHYARVSCHGHEFLRNGSRKYLDHGYLEYATPACSSTSDAVATVRAGDLMIRNATTKLEEALEKDESVMAVRNNIDQRGHSFGGCHVNVRMTRQGYERIFSNHHVLNGFVVPFFFTLPLICGSGRCSSEDGEDVFQIWQRGDFLHELVGLQTTYDRPLVNTRDEPLAADPEKYARFHIISFDANRLEIAEYLKLGLLRLLCAAIDAECTDINLEPADPIAAIRSISRQPFKPIRLASNKTITALKIQRAFQAAFNKLYEQDIFTGRVPDAAEILARWDQVLTQLEQDLFTLVGCLDWVTKYVWLEQIRCAKKLKWSSPEIRWLDIQYHCLTHGSPDVPLERITTDQQIAQLISNGPPDSRAALRGQLLSRFGSEIKIANWHYVVSPEGEIAYLLPDDPEPGFANVIDSGKTFEVSARLLNLTSVRLNSESQTEIQVIQISEQNEKPITL